MMTAYGSVEKAVEAMRKGAFDYILKPFKNEELKLTVRKAIDHYQLVRRNRYLTRELQERYQFGNIIGKSAPMQRIYQLIEKVAPSKATVLITGESGTGKELIARAIHFNSPRREQPFITVNCGALPETLLESELFGHERGAFTGAVNLRKGRFELAHEGTLSWMKSAKCRPRSRSSSCACCRRWSSNGLAAARPSRWMCAWSPPPIAISRKKWPRAVFARIFSTASMSFTSSFPP